MMKLIYTLVFCKQSGFDRLPYTSVNSMLTDIFLVGQIKNKVNRSYGVKLYSGSIKAT